MASRKKRRGDSITRVGKERKRDRGEGTTEGILGEGSAKRREKRGE
jgi:hypothetical protein